MNVNRLSVSYPSGPVFRDFDASFDDGAITLVLGASGCGKTTLLRSIADREMRTGAVSFVFQEPRLIPWISVRANLALSLAASNFDGPVRKSRIDYFLDLVSLLSRAEDSPESLSGGERQRVSIARAFANPAPVLLMDEPFQSQDPATKRQLIGLVRELQKLERRTIIAVTHNLDETELYGDALMLLSGKPASILFQSDNNAENRKKIANLFHPEPV